MEKLHEAGVATRRGVMAAHREPTFDDHDAAPLPNTEWLADRAMIMPMYHSMTESDLGMVVDRIGRVADGE
jgi:dTDP-4-amino-4,6-dideoxygalactose transaminase